MKLKLQEFFHSKKFHYGLSILIFVDFAIVMADISIILVHCDHLTDSWHHVVEILRWLSVSILCLFAIELLIQIATFGLKWLKHWMHVLDIFVVFVTLVFEIFFHDSAEGDLIGILVIFRMWRLVRVLHITTEALEHAYVAKIHELQKKLKKLNIKNHDLEKRGGLV